MQSLERTKRVIIALHGWTGNINSLKPLAKLWKFPATEWVYIQGSYKKIQRDTLGLEEIIGMVGDTKNRFKN